MAFLGRMRAQAVAAAEAIGGVAVAAERLSPAARAFEGQVEELKELKAQLIPELFRLIELYLDAADTIRRNPLVDPTRLGALEDLIRRFGGQAVSGLNFQSLARYGTGLLTPPTGTGAATVPPKIVPSQPLGGGSTGGISLGTSFLQGRF